MDISYKCWMDYGRISDDNKALLNVVVLDNSLKYYEAIKEEFLRANASCAFATDTNAPHVRLKLDASADVSDEGFIIEKTDKCILLAAKDDRGILYAVFRLLQLLTMNEEIGERLVDSPACALRMVNMWDMVNGRIERGYAGTSLLYKDGGLNPNEERINDYARILASLGINGIGINNTNVHDAESQFINDKIDIVKKLNNIFTKYGIEVYVSINYCSSMIWGGLDTSDPLDTGVIKFWEKQIKFVYEQIPDLGGFMVKADSEHRPGPFSYNRNHAEGANMLAAELKKYGGKLFWRCFVYNCKQDWRDRKTDRAMAAYGHFKPFDELFMDNVYLQIKNGPIDFQIREPISPLFGALNHAKETLELQVTAEYTGQQKHICYLAPLWKEVLDFDTYAHGKGTTVSKIVTGIAGIINVGEDLNWTGHIMSQANLYAFCRLAWNSELTEKQITTEWIRLTFGNNQKVFDVVNHMLTTSREQYENYTTPLGVGFMVNPGYHYGPNINGYEYSPWGTYHLADCKGIGVDRTVKTGTGYAGQYFKENAEIYENIENCPDNLILFFHHVPYTHVLHSGKTVIQHIYDTHFAGVEACEEYCKLWDSLKGHVDEPRFNHICERLQVQLGSAKEWRDVVNTFFYRMSGIEDDKNRRIYT